MKLDLRDLWEWIQAIIIAVVLAFLINTFIVQNTRVIGSSMYPTLHEGDRLFVNKLSYRIDTPKRGDIVIVHKLSKADLVKRVIGLPGEFIEIKDGKLFIDDKEFAESYIIEKMQMDFPRTYIPEGSYFVMGDNRNRSKDSRDPLVGLIPRKNLSGKVKLRYWPLYDISWFK